jgi:hypothetical protein
MVYFPSISIILMVAEGGGEVGKSLGFFDMIDPDQFVSPKGKQEQVEHCNEHT